jgi:hypothetical protein
VFLFCFSSTRSSGITRVLCCSSRGRCSNRSGSCGTRRSIFGGSLITG